MTRFSLPTVALFVVAAATPAFAQYRNSGQGGSGFGSSGGSGFGSGSSSGSGFGGGGGDVSGGFGGNTVSGFGDTSSFGQSSGMNALSSGLGGSAAGMGTSLGSNQGGSMGSTSSRSGMGGSSTNRNRSSSSRSGTTGMTGQRSPGRSGGFGMNGMAGIGGMNNFNNMNRNNRMGSRGIGVQQAIHPVITIALDSPPPALAASSIAQSVNASFAQNQIIAPTIQGVQVVVAPSGDAVLRGTAATEHQRTIAAAMLAMDPGVRAVRNEIVVNPSLPPIASPTLPPPATPSLQNSR